MIRPILFAVLFPTLALAADPAASKSYRFDLGQASDLDASQPARITTPDRFLDAGKDGAIAYRPLKPKMLQAGLVVPAFDFDKDTGSINRPFYLTIRFKDTVDAPAYVYVGKGGTGLYGAGLVGQFGGAADNQWKTETIIIRRSMMRCQDGETFRLVFANVKADLPLDWIELFSSASGLNDRDERIAAANKLEQDRREANFKKLTTTGPEKDRFVDLGLPEPGQAAANTDAEKQAGFRVFFPPLNRALFTNSQPLAGEMEAPKYFSTPGQTQTVLVAVRGIKDGRVVSVSLKDFSGVAIKSTVRWAVFSPQRVGSSWGKEFRTTPDQLIDQPTASVKADEVSLAAITLRVPGDAKPGQYTASLEASTYGERISVPVTLTVYPFTLERPAHSTHGLFSYVSLGDLDPMEIQDMADHGMDTIVCGPPNDAAGKFLPEKMKAGLKLLQDKGFRAPIMIDPGFAGRWQAKDTPENRRQYIAYVSDIVRTAEAGGFKAPGIFAVDEPHTPDKIATAKLACTWVKEIPGAKTFITSNPKAVPILDPVLDYVCYNLTYLKPEVFKQVADSGDTLMYYCPSFSTNPEDVRFRNGFYMARSGAQASYYFAYMELIGGDPFDDFDGPNRDWNSVFPSMTSATHDTSLSWENQREGVMDCRYVYTLKATIERAKKTGKTSAVADAVIAAQKVYDQVMFEIDPTGEKAAGPAGAIEANTALKGVQLDRERLKPESLAKTSTWYNDSRHKIAQAIINLKKAMGE